VRVAVAGGRERLGLVDRPDLGLVDDLALEHADHHLVRDRCRLVVLVGDPEHRVVVLAGKHRLVVALRHQLELGLQQHRRRLEAGVRGRRGERKLLALEVGGRLDRAVGRDDDFHLVAERAALRAHDGERHIARAVDRDRRWAGADAGDVQPAGAHRLDLGGIRLHREEHHAFSGHLLGVLDEAVPHLGVQGRILDRRVGKDQRGRIDELLRISRRIGDEIAVAVAIVFLQIAARAVLSRGGTRESEGDQPSQSCDPLPHVVPPCLRRD
jgi:hypothetical protein